LATTTVAKEEVVTLSIQSVQLSNPLLIMPTSYETSNPTSKSTTQPQWKDSEAKKTLTQDIVDGFVTDAMTPKQVYSGERKGRLLNP
jgi:hypothetical protein